MMTTSFLMLEEDLEDVGVVVLYGLMKLVCIKPQIIF